MDRRCSPIIGCGISFATYKTKRLDKPTDQSVGRTIRGRHREFFQLYVKHEQSDSAMVFETCATIAFQKEKIMPEPDDRHPICTRYVQVVEMLQLRYVAQG